MTNLREFWRPQGVFYHFLEDGVAREDGQIPRGTVLFVKLFDQFPQPEILLQQAVHLEGQGVRLLLQFVRLPS